MKLVSCFLLLITILAYPQDNSPDFTKPGNTFEIKIGEEIYRTSLAGGIGYNINGRYFSIAIGLDIWGYFPFLNSTVKVPLRLLKYFSIYPKLGAGITIFGLLFSTGAGIKYSLSENHALLLEVNQVFINAPKIWLGSPSDSKSNIKEFPPLSVLIGIEL